MRAAVESQDSDEETRRVEVQAASDALRGASIRLSAVVPVGGIRAFGTDLQGRPVLPALSADPDVRALQEAGLRRVVRDLQQRGQNLEEQAAPLAEALSEGPPVFSQSPTALLVLTKAWYAAPHAVVVALCIDLLALGLYWIIARVNDSLGNQREEKDLSPQEKLRDDFEFIAEVIQVVQAVGDIARDDDRGPDQRRLPPPDEPEAAPVDPTPPPIGPEPYPPAAAARAGDNELEQPFVEVGVRRSRRKLRQARRNGAASASEASLRSKVGLAATGDAPVEKNDQGAGS